MLTHKGTTPLTTERLTLRRFTIDDAQAMYDNWATDQNVTKFLSWENHTSVDVTKKLLTKWVAEYDNPTCYHWVIGYGNDIIGSLNLHNISDKSLYCNMGYCIGSKWWGKGIVTEAVSAVMKYAFTQLNMHKICALHDTENIGSGLVMQKNSMQCEGTMRMHTLRRDGTFGDIKIYGILAEEWSKHNDNNHKD